MIRRKALCAMVLVVLAAIVARPAYAYSAPAANFLDLFEYKFDVDASHLFLRNQIKQDVIAGHSPDSTIGKINRQIIGFSVSASDI